MGKILEGKIKRRHWTIQAYLIETMKIFHCCIRIVWNGWHVVQISEVSRYSQSVKVLKFHFLPHHFSIFILKYFSISVWRLGLANFEVSWIISYCRLKRKTPGILQMANKRQKALVDKSDNFHFNIWSELLQDWFNISTFQQLEAWVPHLYSNAMDKT